MSNRLLTTETVRLLPQWLAFATARTRCAVLGRCSARHGGVTARVSTSRSSTAIC